MSSNLLVWKFCGKAQFRDSPEILQKLCLSTKFQHQEISSNWCVLRNESLCQSIGNHVAQIMFSCMHMNFLRTDFLFLSIPFFYSFLKRRQQNVKVNNTHIVYQILLSEVP